MTSIPRLCRTLKTLFESDAPELARACGLRERLFSARTLAYLLILGWWQNPQAGPSALARFAGSLGVRVSKQVIDERLTMRTADWLLALLRRAVQYLVCAQAVSIPLLRRFTAVLVEDGSTISLPAVLKSLWRGSGGSGPEAALKLTVRWDLLAGGLQGPYLQDGRQHETQSPLRSQAMPRGSLWIGDLGYFALIWLSQLVKQGVYFLMGFKEPITVCTAQGQSIDILDVLPPEGQQTVDVPVSLGARKQISARLIARKAAPATVQRRREHLRERAHKQCKPINPRQWELAQWIIVVTNVPSSLLSASEALTLMRARWQIELLWKLWKSLGLLDEWRTGNPVHILCELYAKLLGVLVQHWLILLCCWDDPHRSLTAVAQVIREQVPTLVHGLLGRISLGKALRLLQEALGSHCSIPKRQTRPSTSYLLLEGPDWGLT